jgi:hypothetical protein
LPVCCADAVRRWNAAARHRGRPDSLPRTPGRLYGEIAFGHLQRRELDGALRNLQLSYDTAPETAPYAPLTRGVAVELVRSARGSMKGVAVALAEQMGTLPAA